MVLVTNLMLKAVVADLQWASATAATRSAAAALNFMIANTFLVILQVWRAGERWTRCSAFK